MEKRKGVTGLSPFADLHGGFDVIQDTCLDMMHLAYGVIGRHLIPYLIGLRGKTAVAREQQETKEAEEHEEETGAHETLPAARISGAQETAAAAAQRSSSRRTATRRPRRKPESADAPVSGFASAAHMDSTAQEVRYDYLG
jgi:hypothetical protein